MSRSEVSKKNKVNAWNNCFLHINNKNIKSSLQWQPQHVPIIHASRKQNINSILPALSLLCEFPLEILSLEMEELLLDVLLVGDTTFVLSSFRGILLRMWFFEFWVEGASGGPNRRLYESLPGLLVTLGVSGPLLLGSLLAVSLKIDDPSWDWLWGVIRRGLVSSGPAPKISLLPPPGGFNTLKKNIFFKREAF